MKTPHYTKSSETCLNFTSRGSELTGVQNKILVGRSLHFSLKFFVLSYCSINQLPVDKIIYSDRYGGPLKHLFIIPLHASYLRITPGAWYLCPT